MKLALASLLAFVLAILEAPAQDAAIKDTKTGVESSAPTEANANGERDGAATVLHPADVMRDRGGERHLWPLLHTPEARVTTSKSRGGDRSIITRTPITGYMCSKARCS